MDREVTIIVAGATNTGKSALVQVIAAVLLDFGLEITGSSSPEVDVAELIRSRGPDEIRKIVAGIDRITILENQVYNTGGRTVLGGNTLQSLESRSLMTLVLEPTGDKDGDLHE